MELAKSLEKRLKIKINNPSLFKQALIHRSYINESKEGDLKNNERLEFLGDAVLSFVMSSWLYKEFPEFPEGNMTNMRSNLVKTGALAEIAKNLKIGEFLFLSKGEEDSGGRSNNSLLADALEAIIGAIYLDQGVETAREFITSNFRLSLEKVVKNGEFKDYKSLLQEKIQATIKNPPAYKTIREEGPDHAKTFTVGVYSNNKLICSGKGKSKQEAEESAAKLALVKLADKK